MDGLPGLTRQDPGLFGRATECALLEALGAAVRRGESRSLVLRGEAGIGKTALLGHLVASMPDVTVVRAEGVESDMELAFAGLHQLCGPLLDRIERLPGPQRDALEIVFGARSGPPPDRFLVGLAVLSLLSDAADERPVLCVVDDAQWLDRSTALTLAFVARRLLAEPIGFVFAARDPGDELRQLPQVEITGVRNGDARALLSASVSFKLDDRVRDRIIAETHGNPLALLELPWGLTAAQLAGGFGLVGDQVVGGHIEQTFVRRADTLSDGARSLVLVAAADPLGDPLLFWRAAEHLGHTDAAAEVAEAQGLLTIGERVTFRHPLVRSAMYKSATGEDRRAVHLALADATDGEADPDRRAWHLAAATAGPDEDVALELERSAGRAQTRGGFAAGGAFLRRAAQLTSDPGRRVDRALAAAEASLQAGSFDEARALVDMARTTALGELQRARLEMLQGRMALLSTVGSAAPPLLLQAARRLEPLDVSLARDTYLDAWGAALMAALTTGASLIEVSEAAMSAPRPVEDVARPSDLLLDALAMSIAEGPAAAQGLLVEATRTFADAGFPTEASMRWGWLTVVPAYALWDETSMHAICTRQISAAREAGALAQLMLDLTTLSMLAVRCGSFQDAIEAIAEAGALAEATGSEIAPHSAMVLAVYRGREFDARTLIRTVKHEAAARGQGVAIQLVEWVLPLLCNSLGRYDDALEAASNPSNPQPWWHAGWIAIEVLEAATRCGETEVAAAAFEQIMQATAFAPTASAQGILARSRALISDGEAADGWYREAIAQLGRSRLRPDLARAHLLYGEWLRRQGRRLDAREHLRTANGMFVAMDMEAFAERARHELFATGEKARKRRAETRDDLTAQERQIARLARDGLSNPEIGARLFLSPRTVEWHLSNVFGKLGIRSRKHLAEALVDDSNLVGA